MNLVVPNLSGFSWSEIRAGLQSVIQPAAPLASVHKEWKLEFDGQGIGRVTQQLKGKNAHSGFVHCWMIGLAADTPETTDGGDDVYVGGNTSVYHLTFAVWGFFDYNGWRARFGSKNVVTDETAQQNSTAAAENEARAVKAYIRANPTLLSDSGRFVCQPFGFENMDSHAFSGGQNIIIVQGGVRVRVRDGF